MSDDRFQLKAAVYVLLERDNKLLFLRRFNTGWKDGHYTLPAGHLDGNESIQSSMARELTEETGIEIDPNELEVIHTMHRISSDSEYIDFYLRPKSVWEGQPYIAEPDKCDDLRWIDKTSLPQNILRNVKVALESISNNKSFSEIIE